MDKLIMHGTNGSKFSIANTQGTIDRLAEYESLNLTPAEIADKLARLEAERDAAVEELYNAAPCFACKHFKRYETGTCFGAGRCRYAEPEMSQYPDGFEWRGLEDTP